VRRSLTRLMAACVLVLASLAVYAVVRNVQPHHQTETSPFRAFNTRSYWNTPLPLTAPPDPNSTAMIEYIQADSRVPYLHLSGATSDGGWGEPTYWVKSTDPIYDVNETQYELPPEFKSIRIPAGARPAGTRDSQMTLFDREAGAVYKLHHAIYNASKGTWSAGGGAYYYIASNGLAGRVDGADDLRNQGHRGVPPGVHAVRWDEIAAGRIDHALKIAINTPSTSHVWPMWKSDGDSLDPDAPPQGARIRIRPSVDLSRFDLSRSALVIATALQRYGAVIGDSSGRSASLKVENTVMEGRGWLWNGVLTPDSLESIPLRYFEIVQLGYRAL